MSKIDISCYRDRLDETLTSQELKDEDRLKELVKQQSLQSSQVEYKEYVDEVVERRTKELSNLLDMLRSASIGDIEKLKPSKESRDSWKVKHDTDEFRVMYREGPEGTPFHTLLVEGYVDGPVDVCLCVAWEAALFPKWWPQSTIPSFKVTSSKCLQRARIGEQISLVRMKLSWPLSAREAVVHFYELDYFQDGLLVMLFNSISDKDTISKSTHGFDRDGIPDSDNVVRIDVVGGMAMQKVTSNRSYFRVIANLDVKLDVVPPAFINFIARQLLGSGFKLFKKEVASICRGDEDFAKVLKDPQYERIRETLYTKIQDGKEEYNDIQVEQISEESGKTKDDQSVLVGKMPREKDDHLRVEEKEPQCEIEEIEEDDDEKSKRLVEVQSNQIVEEVKVNEKRNVPIRPEVKRALSTLDKAIEIIRENKSNVKHNDVPNTITVNANIEELASKASSASNAEKIVQSGIFSKILSNKECRVTTNDPRNSSAGHSSRRSGSSSYGREARQSKVVPASPDEYIQGNGDTQQVSVESSMDQTTGPSLEKTTVENNASNTTIDSIHGESRIGKKSKRLRLCCLQNNY